MDEHSRLLGPLVSFEENKVLRILSLSCIHNTSKGVKS
jgi:hypothetical protein